MEKFAVCSILTTLFFLFSSPVARAQDEKDNWEDIGCGYLFGPGMIARLGLTEEQQDRILELEEAMFSDLEPVIQKLEEKRERMRKLWSATSPDKRQIINMQREMEPLRQKIRERRVDFRLEVIKLLTPTQRNLLTTNMKSGRAYSGMGRGGPFGRGRGWGYRRGYGRGGCRGFGRGYGRGGM